jgi:general secretion pathway protein K
MADSGGHRRKDAGSPGGVGRTDRGFVLLIVLWWLAFLIFLGTQITAATRTAILISSNIRTSAVAEAQANGAVNEAIFQVLAQQWKADGTTHFVRGTQAVTAVRITDEGDRIDPNVAPVILMQALLRECGATPKAAEEIAAAIFDWRSIEMLQSVGTAKASQYIAAALGYVPPHSRFVSVDELGLVIGMTQGLLACIAPHVSVYSLSVPSAQTTADPVVRQALSEAYPYDPTQAADATGHEVAVIRVTATTQAEGGGRFRRIAVVRIAPAEPDDHFVYEILAWE